MPLATQKSLRMFFTETFEEIKDQQSEESTNKGLVERLERQTALLKKAILIGDDPREIVQALVQVSAYAARIATEGDPAHPKYRWPYE